MKKLTIIITTITITIIAAAIVAAIVGLTSSPNQPRVEVKQRPVVKAKTVVDYDANIGEVYEDRFIFVNPRTKLITVNLESGPVWVRFQDTSIYPIDGTEGSKLVELFIPTSSHSQQDGQPVPDGTIGYELYVPRDEIPEGVDDLHILT